MTLKEKLETLQDQYNQMRKYYLVCSATGSLLNYSSADFDREGMLLKKINETKNSINESNKKTTV